MWVVVCKKPVWQKTERSRLLKMCIVQIRLFLEKFSVCNNGIFKIIRRSSHDMTCRVHLISGIVNAPVSISCNLATNSANCVSNHQGWSNCISQMPDANFMLSGIKYNCDSSTDQSTIKGQPA